MLVIALSMRLALKLAVGLAEFLLGRLVELSGIAEPAAPDSVHRLTCLVRPVRSDTDRVRQPPLPAQRGPVPPFRRYTTGNRHLAGRRADGIPPMPISIPFAEGLCRWAKTTRLASPTS